MGQPAVLEIVDAENRVLATARMEGRSRVQVPIGGTCRLRFRVKGGGLAVPTDLRLLDLRLFYCGWADGRLPLNASSMATRPSSGSLTAKINHLLRRAAYADSAVTVLVPVPRFLRDLLRRKCPLSVSPEAAPTAPLRCRTPPAFLHSNGCGDFTLMHRDRWRDLRGYAELDLFSMNLDAVLCYAAYHSGLHEEILLDPMRIYHIEHGSGWTPDGEINMYHRLTAKGIPHVDYHQVVQWVSDMRRFDAPLIFNGKNWGLADVILDETTPVRDDLGNGSHSGH